MNRDRHVMTFLKLFSSIQEQGPSARSFHSLSFFSNRSTLVPFRSILVVPSRRTVHPVFSVFLVFLVEERFCCIFYLNSIFLFVYFNNFTRIQVSVVYSILIPYSYLYILTILPGFKFI